MKKLASIIVSMALASSAFAGAAAYSGKGGKVVNPPVAEDCFGPGFSLGINATGAFERGGDDGYGGGVLAQYFFCKNFGIEGSYNIVDLQGGLHIFNADLVLRFPIESACVAPYILVGGGLNVDGGSVGQYQVGGGLDVRIRGSKVGLFADGTYNWVTGDEDRDYTLVRVGLKFRL